MLTERRVAARERKLAGLEDEFKKWEQASSQNGQLRLHHSQIGRILAVLRPLSAQIAQPPAGRTARPLTDREIETVALELHRIWEFFRAKFAMRNVGWLKTYLDAVDDFAWACYKPARDAAEAAGTLQADALKEPPLLFFGGGWSPFAMPRNYAFDAERVPQEPVRTQAFLQTLKKLPVPVVGIPWFQVRHLPDAVVIGHEVGHIVEDDLGLTTPILDAIRDGADPRRRAAWQSWGGEIFGDLYGQLATGPAFASGLAEVLGDDPAWIARQTVRGPAWGEYPPTYLRMKMNVALLRALEFTDAADRLDAEWTAVYGTKHAMTEFDADTDTIAGKLVTAKFAAFGGKTIVDVLSFTALHDEADVAADALRRGAAPDPGNVRALVAAAQMHFAQKPAAYTEQVQSRVLDTIATSLPPGVRGAVEDTQRDAAGKLSDDLFALLAGGAQAGG